MDAYSGEFSEDADLIGRMLADNGFRLIGAGHTYYNKILNDGRVVYVATRSTVQIEEDAPASRSEGATAVASAGGSTNWRRRGLLCRSPLRRISGS